MTTIDKGHAFIDLMRRYVVEYTNAHDQSVTERLMVPDYMLRMGEHVVRGRDDLYREATRKQMAQFPGLGLTVHRIATSGERLVMRFSEHGASRLHGGRPCSWAGIGLYRWDGERLTGNWVEQDYFSRRRQLESGRVHAVFSPAVAPWDTEPEAADPVAEAIVRDWLAEGNITGTTGVGCDDQWITGVVAPLIEQSGIEINDLFSCGPLVAFHVTQHGRFVPGDDIEGPAGAPAFLHMAGYVELQGSSIAGGMVVRNRIDLMRRMRPAI